MKCIFAFSITFILVLALCTSSVFAQTGFEGMACFRDGVLGGIEWHAGMVIKPTVSYISHSATETWIYPEDISKLRCDGVVEFCYESLESGIKHGIN